MTQHPPADAGPRRHSFDDPETLRSFVRHLREGLYVADGDGRIVDATPAFLAMAGVGSVGELAGRDDVLDEPERRRADLAALARDGAVRESERRLRRADGEVRQVLDTVWAVSADDGTRLYHGIVLDLGELVDLERRVRDGGARDVLTGTWSRHYLPELAARLKERGVSTWGCIFLDIDGFREYNERHGSARGDELLVRMSHFLLRQVRAEEAVVRLGADEFLVVLAGADEARTENVARRLQLAALRAAPAPFSLGWTAREPGETLEATVQRADRKLLPVRVIERAMEEWQRREA